MVHISEHFNFKKIFKITISPILMMIFISLYGVVDGVFVSNFAGKDAYSGVNLIMPVIMIIGGMGFMIGTGGSALSSKYLGEKNKDKANEVFSTLLLFTLLLGIVVSIIGYFLIEPIANKLGSITHGTTQGMVDEAIKYGKVLVLGQSGFMVQNLFHSYFMVDEKPRMGFLCTVFAGVTNMIFDALFIGIFKWGVIGAALATILGYVVGSIVPLIHFIRCKDGNINLVKCGLDFKVIGKACFNGSSEFINNISASVVSLVYSIQLLRFYGQNGISAYGTIMYVSFIFIAIFIGYSIGLSPVIGYNYGARNSDELKNVLKKSVIIILSISTIMVILCYLLAPLLSKLFSSNDESLELLSMRAIKIYSISYIFCGLSIFITSFFTALNNGIISAINSIIRTLISEILFVFLFPLFLGADGIWWAIVGSEVVSLTVGLIFLKIYQKRYNY